MSIRTQLANWPLALLALGAAACSSTQASVEVEPSMAPYDVAVRSGQAYTMVIMRRGPAQDAIDRAEMGALTQAHMDFTAELAEGDLLLASGPVVAPRAEPSMRSIGFYDSANTSDVHSRVCSDPAVEAGVLEVRSVPFICADDIRAIPGMERGSRMERGDDMIVARPYVIVEVPTSSAMDAMIQRMDEIVLFSGHCVGGGFEGSTLIAVDCRTSAEAAEFMGAMGPVADDFLYHPWVSSTSVAEMK